MKPIVKISDLPNVLSIDELMEVKGGLLDNNKVCLLLGIGVKCVNPGSGVCTVEGAGIICSGSGSGVVLPNPDPHPTPGPDPGTENG